ncbi:signal peptidase I [Psychrobacillus sp. OK032]|uniref:signal peptidase I n=1 Tax=Psychrobacillus sp. OK032 TaxID=1884358 RepID=UPI0008AF7A15|nr:signal peptidase I [Psychrobacillus sp. OK032]SER63950.1 signal peptidase I [Psychrobacillus sp. OK032]
MSKTKKEIIEWLTSLVIGIVVVLFVRSFLATNYEIVGESMMPTLHDHNHVLISKVSKIKRMDVIIFHSDEKEDYVKRVIGLPGDTITYENDQLFINNNKVDEPFLSSYEAYINTETNFTGDFNLLELTGSKTVPPGKLFVLGDNRISSLDSRYFHFIDQKEVIGELKLIYWPISDFKVNFRSE